MKTKHTTKKSANRSFDKRTTAPKGWNPYTTQQHFSPKPNSKTQQLKQKVI